MTIIKYSNQIWHLWEARHKGIPNTRHTQKVIKSELIYNALMNSLHFWHFITFYEEKTRIGGNFEENYFEKKILAVKTQKVVKNPLNERNNYLPPTHRICRQESDARNPPNTKSEEGKTKIQTLKIRNIKSRGRIEITQLYLTFPPISLLSFAHPSFPTRSLLIYQLPRRLKTRNPSLNTEKRTEIKRCVSLLVYLRGPQRHLCDWDVGSFAKAEALNK